MDTLTINIINPKALKLINDLAELNLISIKEIKDNPFDEILDKLRSKSNAAPSLDEITAEVESTRADRYGS